MEALGPQGCTINADLDISETQTGLARDVLADAVAEGLSAATAKRQGDWIVFGATVCEITLPQITSEARLTDPDVAAQIADLRELIPSGPPGCYLFDVVDNALEQRAGWDADRANLAWITMTARGLIDGDLAFYSEDPLATPAGFELITDTCAEVKKTETLRAEHDALRQHFGGYIHFLGAQTRCDDAASFDADRAVRLVTPEAPNAFRFLPVIMVTLSAGWWEGMSATQKGTPRPPLCHY